MNNLYRKVFLLISIFFFIISPFLSAAQNDTIKAPADNDMENLKEQVVQLIEFYEYTLNTIGNSKTSAKEKEIIINQSYTKLFVDEEVQIEDDLDENRVLILNKDVQAYLKDIDFFFKNVKFTNNIEQINPQFNEENQMFFIVTLNRNLNGITITNDTINNNKIRFIEINYNDLDRDLRIASIYTTKLDEREELRSWWSNLPATWKEVFGSQIIIKDTLRLSDVAIICDSSIIIEIDSFLIKEIDTLLVYGTDTLFINEFDTLPAKINDTIPYSIEYIDINLKRISNKGEINIENNHNIYDLTPLSQLSNLKRLNCSNTSISNLSPIRNLSRLESLECSKTLITTIFPLKYCINLRKLIIDNTRIHDLGPVASFTQLEILHFNNTTIFDLESVSALENLKDFRFENTLIGNLGHLSGLINLELVNCSKTRITDIEPLASLTKLERLYCEDNRVSDLSPLKNLKNLQNLYFDNSSIESLSPLDSLPCLKNIYCDNTRISDKEANQFMERNPNILVIYESEALIHWWNDLPVDWQMVFSNYIDLSSEPTKEQLHLVANLSRIDISHNGRINSLHPLIKLKTLKELYMSKTMINNLKPLSDHIDLKVINGEGTKIKDLTPLKDLIELEMLNISNTKVSDLEPLKELNNLQILYIENTKVRQIMPLKNLKGIKTIYCNDSEVDLQEVLNFNKFNPECLVVFRSAFLDSWWKNLPAGWKEVFSSYVNTDDPPTIEQLHKITNLTEIDINNNKKIKTLVPLKELKRINTIDFSGTQINNLDPIQELTQLEHLEFSDNPVQNLDPVKDMTNLKHLEFKNTPVENLKPLYYLTKLEILNCAGTQIKDLKYLEYLNNLRVISFYNTKVKNLKPIGKLNKLETIECYNTRIPQKKIQKFKEIHPRCEVVFY